MTAFSSVVHPAGPFAEAIRSVIDAAWIAPGFEEAAAHRTAGSPPIVTLDGYVFRGPRLVAGGGRSGGRGILQTRREIKELVELIASRRDELRRIGEETSAHAAAITLAAGAIAALDAERHRYEKTIVAGEAQDAHGAEEEARLRDKAEQLARERRQAEEERDALERRQQEARASITRLEAEQRTADEQLTVAQRRLFEAREASEDLNRRAAAA